MSIDKARFRQLVIPGDQLLIEVKRNKLESLFGNLIVWQKLKIK